MIPKVTVLMTVFNGERYLKESMDSVLKQTFKDFEFLIIDDQSADSSLNIIKSYTDNRIRIIENRKNLGQVRSLNIGLGLARGEYVARMDQDDIMMKDRLKKQVIFLDERTKVDVVGTWCEVMDEKGRIFERSCFPVRNEEIIGNVLFGGYFLAHPTVVFRKDVVIEAGKYNESFSFAEDYDLWTRLLLKRHKLANIPEFLIKFRCHERNSSKQFYETQIKNAHISISNFINTVSGPYSEGDLYRLCNILMNAGLVTEEYWKEEKNVLHIDNLIAQLEACLEKTISYFNFKKQGIYLIKKVFCNRMLNFAYGVNGEGKKKSLPLYLFCLRNYPFLWTRPKLYIYPIRLFV